MLHGRCAYEEDPRTRVVMMNYTCSTPAHAVPLESACQRPENPKRKTRPAIRRSARWRGTLRAGVRRAIIGERTNSDRRRRRDEEQRTRRKNAGHSGIMPGLWVAKPHADSAPCTCTTAGGTAAISLRPSRRRREDARGAPAAQWYSFVEVSEIRFVGGGATQAPAREAAR